MRIDFPQGPVQGNLQIKTGTSAFTESLKEGDRVRVDVLSGEKDAVIVKTEGGQIFKARLDTDAVLSQGDKVLLEFSGKEGKLVFLSILGRSAANDEAAALTALVRDFEDKSLAPYAGKLADLHMPVNEETARAMKELIALNPGMTLDEAAFLASNKLGGDENLVRAALALLSDGDKTDALLARLIALLDSPGSEESAEQRPASGNMGNASLEANPSHSVLHTLYSAPGEAEAPLMDWLRLVAESTAGASAANDVQDRKQTAVSGAQIAPESIISQSDTVLQSGNVINYVENLQNENFAVEKPLSEPQNVMITQGENMPPPTQTSVSPPLETVSLSAPQTPNLNEEAPLSALRTPNSNEAAQQSTLQTSLSNETGKVIARMLSNLPEFHGTPEAALERFSNILLRIANESSDTTYGSVKKLSELFDQLFTRIEKNDKETGERLKSMREEIFARLTLAEETISRAAPSAKTEMLEQTRRLMDHIRTLNSIDQFIYVQLPVRMGEERRTAELYLFRKKNGKKIDPDNANILLVLDLENMGHWEGLINIRNKDVSLQMEVRGEAEKEFFSEKTVMLHELLADAGFRLVNTGITYNKEETTPLTALSVLERHLTGRSGLVDVTV